MNASILQNEELYFENRFVTLYIDPFLLWSCFKDTVTSNITSSRDIA